MVRDHVNCAFTSTGNEMLLPRAPKKDGRYPFFLPCCAFSNAACQRNRCYARPGILLYPLLTMCLLLPLPFDWFQSTVVLPTYGVPLCFFSSIVRSLSQPS